MAETGRLYRQMPNPGEGVGDGDSPTEFKAKLDASLRTQRLVIARAQMMAARGMSVLTGDGRLASGVPQLDDMPRIIAERERELVADLQMQGVAPADIPAMVERGLKEEFGL